jgi:DNA-binding MarR family transcriptional regulator
MRSQVLREQSSAVTAFVALLRSYGRLTRELNAGLITAHGLTINDYEVLLHLARAPDRRLRRVDLSARVVLTASGITRLLDGLEEAGLVERATCATDRRVVYAVLTERGLARLREASGSHLAQIDALFAEALDDEEQATLAGLLEQLCAGGEPADCAPPGRAKS